MAAIFQTTFLDAFSWMKIHELQLIFHWALFLRVQLTIFQHWFRWWLGAGQATSHYLNQWWLDYQSIYASLGLNELTNYCQYCLWAWERMQNMILIFLFSHVKLYTTPTSILPYLSFYQHIFIINCKLWGLTHHIRYLAEQEQSTSTYFSTSIKLFYLYAARHDMYI